MNRERLVEVLAELERDGALTPTQRDGREEAHHRPTGFVNGQWRSHALKVVVRVTDSGRGAITDLRIDGQPYDEWNRAQRCAHSTLQQHLRQRSRHDPMEHVAAVDIRRAHVGAR